MSDTKYYTVDDLMVFFQVKDRQTIYNHFNRGLESSKVGKKRYVTQAQLDAYIAAGKKA